MRNKEVSKLAWRSKASPHYERFYILELSQIDTAGRRASTVCCRYCRSCEFYAKIAGASRLLSRWRPIVYGQVCQMARAESPLLDEPAMKRGFGIAITCSSASITVDDVKPLFLSSEPRAWHSHRPQIRAVRRSHIRFVIQMTTSSSLQATDSINALGLIPHKRLFGFVGGLVGGRIEKWKRGLGRCWRLGLLCASATGVGDDSLGTTPAICAR